MNWDSQSPLVAALAAAVVWLSLELKRSQTEVNTRIEQIVKAYEKLAERVSILYEARIEDFRGWLGDLGRARRELES